MSWDWVAIGGVATAASALAIAYQSWFTRRAAVATQAAVDVSRKALELARQEHVAAQDAAATSKRIVLEAGRQRRDARARLLRIEPSGHPQILEVQEFGDPQPIRGGYAFQLPRDGRKRVSIRQELRVSSADQSPVYVTVNRLLRVGSSQIDIGMKEELLPGGGTGWSFYFDATNSVEGWSEVAPTDSIVSAWIAVTDGFDDGTTDSYELQLQGVPLEMDVSRAGVWQVPSSGINGELSGIQYRQCPVRRIYWESRSHNSPLN